MNTEQHLAPQDYDDIQTFSVLGVSIAITSLDHASQVIRQWANDDRGRFVCIRDCSGLMQAVDNPEFFELHKQASMITPDGMPLVWLGQLARKPVTRTCGADLMVRLLGDAEKPALRHYFYGGKPGVAETMRGRLQARFPDMQVAGLGAPPFRPLTRDELEAAARDMNESGADVIWIGISTPKQEYLMRDLAPLVRGTMLGVGAAFDFHAGAVPRAPVWMQRSGLEWLFRLSTEPKRLWRRYLLTSPRFLYRLAVSTVRDEIGRMTRRIPIPPST